MLTCYNVEATRVKLLRCVMLMSAQSYRQVPGQPVAGSARDRRRWRVFTTPQTALVLILIVAVGLSGALPCITHCDRDHDETAAADGSVTPLAWFLCDFPRPFGGTDAQAAPYHHHIAPQPLFEPTLAFAGLLTASLVVTGRLLLRLCRTLLPLQFAPPTPPPRPIN